MEKKRSLGLSIRYCNQEGNAPGGEGLWGITGRCILASPSVDAYTLGVA